MNFKQYLPSKNIQRVLGILGLILLAGVIYFLVTTFVPKQENEDFSLDLLSLKNSETGKNITLDTDNDGAYDWEEELWGLDINNPDSDDDGVLDGKHIQAQKALQERERNGGRLPESNLTQSEKLSRGLATALLVVQQSGGSLNENDKELISNNVTDYVSDLTLGTETYIRDSFTLVENTKENSYAYRDRMTTLFKTYPISANDIELLIQASNDPTEYQGQLRSRSIKYREYLTKLVEMEVPSLIAGRHTELTNNINQISSAIENLMMPEPDDLILLSGLIQLEKITEKTIEAVVKINTYFDIIKDTTLFEGE